MCQTIGNILAQLREKQKESQDQVADSVGISRVAYTRYESDQREPKVSTALKLARHFGVSVEILMGENAENSESNGQNFLTAQEREIIEIYRSLNSEGQSWMMQTVQMAHKTQNFRKGGLSAGTA